MFKVDTLLAVFAFLVKQLLKTANRADENAQSYQRVIDDASHQKNLALNEAKRARTAASKIEALLT